MEEEKEALQLQKAKARELDEDDFLGTFGKYVLSVFLELTGFSLLKAKSEGKKGKKEKGFEQLLGMSSLYAIADS